MWYLPLTIISLSLGKWKYGKLHIEPWPTLRHGGYISPRFWTLGTLRCWATAGCMQWLEIGEGKGVLLAHCWLTAGCKDPNDLTHYLLWNSGPLFASELMQRTAADWVSTQQKINILSPTSHTQTHTQISCSSFVTLTSPTYCVFSFNIYIVYLMVTLSVVVISPHTSRVHTYHKNVRLPQANASVCAPPLVCPHLEPLGILLLQAKSIWPSIVSQLYFVIS